MDEKKAKAKLFLIIGPRRSGTTILRSIIGASPDVATVLFEPHELWHSVMMMHFKRFRGERHRKRIANFRTLGRDGKWAGAKFALNPGIDAMDWIWLPRLFNESKMIFIIRNAEDTFYSYLAQDKESVRGVIPQHVYKPIYDWLIAGFLDFDRTFPERSCLVSYDRMLDDPDKELEKAWILLDIKPVENLKSYIRPPDHMAGKIKNFEDTEEESEIDRSDHSYKIPIKQAPSVP